MLNDTFRLIIQKLSIVLLCIVIGSSMYGQSLLNNQGNAHFITQGGAVGTLQGIAGLYGNPAGLAEFTSTGFDLGYSRRFNLNELSNIGLGAAFHSGNQTFGISLSQYGFDAYNETSIGLSYARKLSEKLTIGGTFRSIQYRVEGFDLVHQVTSIIGLQSTLTKNISIGFVVFNPFNVTGSQDLPTTINTGARFRTNKKVTLFIEASKSIDRPIELMGGLTYELAKAIHFRLAANISQSSIHFGPMVRLDNGLDILIGYSFNQPLGHTSGINLSYKLN